MPTVLSAARTRADLLYRPYLTSASVGAGFPSAFAFFMASRRTTNAVAD